MAKLTAWLVTIIGVLLLLLPLEVINLNDRWFLWTLALAVLIIGIGKLMRNYGKKKKR